MLFIERLAWLEQLSFDRMLYCVTFRRRSSLDFRRRSSLEKDVYQFGDFGTSI